MISININEFLTKDNISVLFDGYILREKNTFNIFENEMNLTKYISYFHKGELIPIVQNNEKDIEEITEIFRDLIYERYEIYLVLIGRNSIESTSNAPDNIKFCLCTKTSQIFEVDDQYCFSLFTLEKSVRCTSDVDHDLIIYMSDDNNETVLTRII